MSGHHGGARAGAGRKRNVDHASVNIDMNAAAQFFIARNAVAKKGRDAKAEEAMRKRQKTEPKQQESFPLKISMLKQSSSAIHHWNQPTITQQKEQSQQLLLKDTEFDFGERQFYPIPWDLLAEEIRRVGEDGIIMPLNGWEQAPVAAIQFVFWEQQQRTSNCRE